MTPAETAAPKCCRCGSTGPNVYFDRHARGWFCRDSRECSLRIKRQRRNADIDARYGRGVVK